MTIAIDRSKYIYYLLDSAYSEQATGDFLLKTYNNLLTTK